MKLWLVIYVLSKAAYVLGPTDDIAQCETRRVSLLSDLDNAFKQGGRAERAGLFMGKYLARSDFNLSCFSSDQRPKVGDNM